MPENSQIPSSLPPQNLYRPAPLPVPNSTKSFWHSEPDEFLVGHRTTAELPSHAKFLVVGSGITGTSAVRWLLEEDGAITSEDILMLEAREACWGATGRVSYALICDLSHLL
jgi:hypothetical protein